MVTKKKKIKVAQDFMQKSNQQKVELQQRKASITIN